jgi:hypothetical protein
VTARAQEIRTGLAWLHAADPVLAQVIDDRPDFDPDAYLRRLPALDLFGALVFQVIGQQISVIAATAIFARLTGHFGGRCQLRATSRPSTKGHCVVSDCPGARPLPFWTWRSASAMGACPRPSCVSCPTRR